jgi:ribonuclease-3
MAADESADEGHLSKARADAVNSRALADRARELGLDRAVRLGRGEDRSGGRDKPSILANVFEAVLGAIYLDGGLDAVRELVQRVFELPKTFQVRSSGDSKTRLQERLQAQGFELPLYQTTAQRGPDHAREFEVQVAARGRILGSGVGSSKRDAEQAAAEDALRHLEEPI